MKKVFLIYGHYKDNSFNAAIKNEFIKQVELNGNSVDVVDLYKEKFNPVFAGEEPDQEVLDHRKRIENSDTIVLIAPIWNFRMPAIVEGWIDKVLAPPWAFKFKKLVGNYGYPIGNLRQKKSNNILHIWLSKISYHNFLFKFAYSKIEKRSFSHVWHI
jgi:NAD(P)H dehydrogenase (quinone)